jgi:hypothetical protein
MKKLDLTNQTFGLLTAVRVIEHELPPTRCKSLRWLCRCACGGTRVVTAAKLRAGVVTQCGCVSGRLGCGPKPVAPLFSSVLDHYLYRHPPPADAFPPDESGVP